MSQPPDRERYLTDLEGLLAEGGPTAPAGRILDAVGRVARVACGDDDAAPGLPERADGLLERARRAFEGLAGDGEPPTAHVARWLASPRGPFSAALAELDRLGALAGGAAELAPGSPAALRLTGRVDELAGAIADRARSERRPMFEAALAASALIVERGVHPEHDRALLALADVVGLQLAAALGGEPLDDEPWKVRAADPAAAERLGALLARALERPDPLAVAPDLLELSARGWPQAGKPAGDLVLHEAPPATAAERVELLPGVWVRPLETELEVEVAPRAAAPRLVPLTDGEPGEPCPAREGHQAGHYVFTLTTGAEEFALVVDANVALVRRG
jgi:hypothetical protein